MLHLVLRRWESGRRGMGDFQVEISLKCFRQCSRISKFVTNDLPSLSLASLMLLISSAAAAVARVGRQMQQSSLFVLGLSYRSSTNRAFSSINNNFWLHTLLWRMQNNHWCSCSSANACGMHVLVTFQMHAWACASAFFLFCCDLYCIALPPGQLRSFLAEILLPLKLICFPLTCWCKHLQNTAGMSSSDSEAFVSSWRYMFWLPIFDFLATTLRCRWRPRGMRTSRCTFLCWGNSYHRWPYHNGQLRSSLAISSFHCQRWKVLIFLFEIRIHYDWTLCYSEESFPFLVSDSISVIAMTTIRAVTFSGHTPTQICSGQYAFVLCTFVLEKRAS